MRFFMVLTCLILVCLIFACDDSDPTAPAPPDSSDVSGSMQSHSDCKSLPAPYDDSQECVEYEYKSNGTLTIMHINTGLNCCPETFEADIYVENNEIVINESKFGGMCDCYCLFDIDYRLVKVPEGCYTLKMIGGSFAEPFIVNLNLESVLSGLECVERCVYPWGNQWL